MLKKLFSLILLLFVCSCVSISEEERKLAEGKEIFESKSPALAAGLSFLPGVGTLYLASEGGRPSKQKDHDLGTLAIINWVTWPASILWAVPQSFIDAKRINIKESLFLELDSESTTAFKSK